MGDYDVTPGVHDERAPNDYDATRYVAPPPPEPAPVQQAAYQTQANGDRELDRAAKAAHEAALEQKYGVGETVTSQFARGALDALLAPGALLGAGAQAAGEAYNAKWLSDFGRDLGRASSGKSAAEAIGFVMGGGGMGGAERADLARQRVEEQEEARPMLSSLSRMAGQAFTAVAAGSAATGEVSALANVGMNVGVGAAGGAQAAYEKSAPLRDVLTSAAVGGLLGGAISGAAEGVSYVARKAPKLGEVFSEKLQKFADESEVKAWAGSGKKFWKQMSPERIERLSGKLRGLEHAADDESKLTILGDATKDAGRDLTTVEEHLNTAGVKPKFGDLFGKIDDQVSKLRGSGTQDAENLANTIEGQLNPLKQKLAIKEIDPTTGAEVVTGYRDPTFTELRNAKTALGQSKNQAIASGQTFAGKEYSKLYGSIAQTLDETAEAAGPGVASVWKKANETYSDLITVQKQVEDRMASSMSNRHFSPTDYLAGMTGFLHASNPLAAGASALGGMVAHKALREGGRAIFATMANRFARTMAKIKVPPDAGPEAQEVLGFLAKTRAFAEDTAERAGNNPTAREAAADAAKNVAAGVAAERAGALDEAAWTRGLSPMQKVLHRSQILDRASSDLSAEATRLADLHPAMPAELDPQRVAKLVKDATPEAIGSVQNTVRDLLETTPNSPTGATAGVALRQLQDSLQVADVAGAMLKAHVATKTLEQLSKHAVDEPSRNFAERATIALRDKLGSDAFGKAGREYQALSARPPEFLENFLDKDRMREVLRSADADGSIPKQIAEAQQRVAAAHDAAYKLAGQARPADLAKQFAKGKKLAEAVEDATTLDGRAMSRFFDVANRAGVYTTGKMLHTEDVGEHTVRETVSEKVDQLAPMLKDAAGISQKKYRPAVLGASAVIPRKVTEDPQAQYDKRMKTLIDITQDPNKIQGGMYANIGPEVGQKMAQLLADAPKADKPLIGQAGTQLSRSDLQLFDDMWEATTRPLSVFDDFRAGRVSYDKSTYAWKQYPGLQQAAQAGTLDLLTHQMSEEEVSKIPHSIITQIDDLLGFGGILSSTTDPAFAARMSQLYQPEANKPKPGGILDTPKAEPTFTQRISGAGT